MPEYQSLKVDLLYSFYVYAVTFKDMEQRKAKSTPNLLTPD